MKKLMFLLMLILLIPTAGAQTVHAPSFTLADANGNSITLPAKQNGVDIYLFWATWCPYCKALMPHLQSMQIEYGENVRVYALHIRDDEDPIAFMSEQGYDFILLPEADPVMALYGVKPIPALFLVDASGDIRFNLYETIFDDSHEAGNMGHKKKASRRAPYWAANIRQSIDQLLAEAVND